jgi:hypothetical protein
MLKRGDANAEWATDEDRIRCFEHVVEIVNSERIEVVRAAYYKKSLAFMRSGTPGEASEKTLLYSICSGGLKRMVAPLLASSFVIPVMDGLDRTIVDPVAASEPILHAFRAAPFYRDGTMSIPNVQNLMDPVFVDSRYSSIMQVADVTAYLLHVLDWERERLLIEGSFKPRIVAVAHTLDPSLVHGAKPIWMNHHPRTP